MRATGDLLLFQGYYVVRAGIIRLIRDMSKLPGEVSQGDLQSIRTTLFDVIIEGFKSFRPIGRKGCSIRQSLVLDII
jgi:hypothetical protein